MTALAIGFGSILAAIVIEGIWQRHENRRMWQHHAAAFAARAYTLNGRDRDEFDHICRGVNPGEVDPLEEHIAQALWVVSETPIHDELAGERLVDEIEAWRKEWGA